MEHFVYLAADIGDTMLNGIIGNVVTVLVGLVISSIVIAVKTQVTDTITKEMNKFRAENTLSREKMKTEIFEKISDLNKKIELQDEKYQKEFEKVYKMIDRIGGH